MAGYSPLYIKSYEAGLVQSRENFLLPNDAYPTLENAYVWRERIRRKQGCELLGRLQRNIDSLAIGNFPAAPPFPPLIPITFTGNLYTISGIVLSPLEVNKSIAIGSVSMTSGAYTWKDFNLDGRLITTDTSGAGYNALITAITLGTSTTISIPGANAILAGDIVFLSGINGTTELNNHYYLVLSSTATDYVINVDSTNFTPYISGGRSQMSPGFITYTTGGFSLTVNSGFQLAVINAGAFGYNPNLPVMGLRTREINSVNNEELVAFDQVYAYIFNGTSFEEFLSNTAATWTGTDFNFFWTTNYWVGNGNLRIFWATNFSGTSGDPIRYTNGVAGTNWVDFAPQINAAANVLAQCLVMLPFRGRLVVFNTLEGPNLASSAPFPQRIRWAAIGNPFTVASPIVTIVNSDAWRDDIRGQGGFLDIPTSEAIVSVGFVRDNLVIYCERSTWQLRYTGRSIAPFQIEKVNSELGSESTFSAVQFDTSLVGIGDKGIVECDSFKSNRIDIKIPDLVFLFNNDNHGTERVHGIRDFIKRLAYWTYPYAPDDQQFPTENYFPNKRLVYNYENDSWAIFDDSYTALGNYQPAQPAKWNDTPSPTWENNNNTWIAKPALIPLLVGGNQQGYVEKLDQKVQNDVSLYISNITGNTTTPTVIQSINHNLLTGAVVEISIPGLQPFNNLDGQVFGIIRVDKDSFRLMVYDPNTGQFSLPQLDAPPGAPYQGSGQIIVRDNFKITSKKFNFLDDGQNIQLGFIDILMEDTDNGAISLNVYLDYNDSNPINIPPDNADAITQQPDTFFNSVVPTSVTPYIGSSKNWQRVFCAARGAFLTIEWTFSNAQMAGDEQEEDVQIDAQILWIRKAGKQLPAGV
jgi:hypothetical protein